MKNGDLYDFHFFFFKIKHIRIVSKLYGLPELNEYPVKGDFMRKIIITNARLTADAVYTQGSEPSKNRVNFSIACNGSRNREDTDFLNVTVFGSRAEYVKTGMGSGRFLKGCEVELEGDFQKNSYTNKNGEKVTDIAIIATDIHSKVQKDWNAANVQSGNNLASAYNPGSPAMQSYGGYQQAQPSYGQNGFSPEIPQNMQYQAPNQQNQFKEPVPQFGNVPNSSYGGYGNYNQPAAPQFKSDQPSGQNSNMGGFQPATYNYK